MVPFSCVPFLPQVLAFLSVSPSGNQALAGEVHILSSRSGCNSSGGMGLRESLAP
jgi:hypothetical protein